MAGTIGKVRSVVLRTLLSWLVRPTCPSTDLIRLGTQAGGWVIPVDVVDRKSICYCAGVGEDISFDLALIEHYGCQVYAFDPTPRAISYVHRVVGRNPQYMFHDIGVWSTDTVLRFYAPRNPVHVSHSIMNLQRSTTYFEAPCRRLSTIMRGFGHTRIDLLKLDIEGAEHAVVGNMLDEGVPVRVLCLEFDQPVGARAMWRTLRRLTSAGYRLVCADGWNCTFIRRTSADDGAVRLKAEDGGATDVAST